MASSTKGAKRLYFVLGLSKIDFNLYRHGFIEIPSLFYVSYEYQVLALATFPFNQWKRTCLLLIIYKLCMVLVADTFILI